MIKNIMLLRKLNKNGRIRQMINHDKFVEWAESRFGDVVIKGDEVRVNSIFAEDYKHHMWCNTKGGKKERANGVYHCWKTDNKGSLVSLVMQIDNCPYDEAMEILEGYDLTFAGLEKQVDEMVRGKSKSHKIIVETNPEDDKISFPDMTYRIQDLPEGDYFRNAAEIHLKERKLPIDKFFVCVGGKYKNRIIIPYYDRNGKLIYFNGRYLGKSKDIVKYMGPDKKTGISKEDVIYMPQWAENGSKIYLTEGEFDAYAISIAGLNGVALGGKEIHDTQFYLMRKYQPVIALDNDKAGKRAMKKIGAYFESHGFEGKVGYVKPPPKYKDWNEMLVKKGARILVGYLMTYERKFDSLMMELKE